MSQLTTSPAARFSGGLFNDCAGSCEAYGACGGNRNSMPCGCAWPSSSGLRFKCEKCYLVCRDRKDQGPYGAVDFAAHLFSGKMIQQVALRQDPSLKFPLFIPMLSQLSKGAGLLPVRWVGADLLSLFNPRKQKGSTLHPRYASEATAREYLNVDGDCQLLAVLNGKDEYLEGLWGMGEVERSAAFHQLQKAGFSAGTGPTFSITARTTVGTPTPHAHNVAMMMRHHKVVGEMYDSGLGTVPNLYWLDGDEREIARWAEWLLKNPHVHTVSRDFTLTRKPETVLRKLIELKHLLKLVGRPLHVLIVGTGPANGPLVLRELARAGHTGIIVTSAPIYDARRTARKYRIDNGRIIQDRCVDRPFSELILNNLSVFEASLFNAVKDTEVEQQFVSNIVSGILT